MIAMASICLELPSRTTRPMPFALIRPNKYPSTAHTQFIVWCQHGQVTQHDIATADVLLQVCPSRVHAKEQDWEHNKDSSGLKARDSTG